jgi:C-terminal processing protease CtpA/Prc
MFGVRVLRVLLVIAMVVSGCAPQRGTIGAILGQGEHGRLFLREVPEGLAASRAGLREGDEILLIDGRDVRLLSTEQVHQALSGDVEEPVKLTVQRNDEVLRVTVLRSEARRRQMSARPTEK